VEESQKVELRVNIEKTKDLRVNSRITEAFRIGEEEMTSCTWDPRFTRVDEHSCTFSRE
jgi:hypothetical protein